MGSSFKEIRRDLREKYPKTASSEQWVDLMELLDLVKAEDFSELLKKVKQLKQPLLYEKKYRMIRKDYDILIKEYKRIDVPESQKIENCDKLNELNSKYQKLKTYSDALSTENTALYSENSKLLKEHGNYEDRIEHFKTMNAEKSEALKQQSSQLVKCNEKLNSNNVFVSETNKYKRMYKAMETKNIELQHAVKKIKIDLNDVKKSQSYSGDAKNVNQQNSEKQSFETEKIELKEKIESMETATKKRQFLFQLFQKKANDCKCEYWSGKVNELQHDLVVMRKKHENPMF